MPKVKISEYSTVNSNNTDINSINIDEGCAPSGINNAIREVMVHLKNWQTNASGDGATFASLVVQGTGSFTGAVTMSAGATLSGTNTLSGSNIMSGNINSSGTNTFSGSQVISGNINSSGSANTFSGGVVHSGTNTFSSSVIISGNINSSGTNTFSGSNVISVGAGTSASPSIYFASDTNTGIFSPAADTIAFAEGGVEAMRIDSSGNVGIGTSSPAQKLDVVGNAVISGYMGVGGAASSVASVFARGTALTGTNQYGVYAAPTGTSAATTSVNGVTTAPATADATFTAASVYGLRTLNATKGAASTITDLHGIRIDDQTVGTNNYGITSLVSSGTNKWNIYASGTAQNYFAGNVGIGTTAPSTKLQVNGTSTFLGSGGASVTWGDTTALGFLSFDGSGNPVVRANTGLPLVFQTNGANERMRIDSSGNVGIGTSSPGASLDIQSTSGDFYLRRFAATTSGPTYVFNKSRSGTVGTNTIVQSGDTLGRILFQGANGTGYTNAAEITSEVDGTPGASNDMPGRIIFSTTPDGSGTLAERMRIDSSGNVGIGVTPSAWGRGKAFEVGTKGTAVWGDVSNGISNLSMNAYLSTNNISTGWLYGINDFASRYQQINGQHQWFTAASGTAGNAITFTQAMTLNASGGLQCLNTVGVGNATPSTSGAGITFPATQSASSDANTLDDYEEGDWTPTISGTSTAGTATYTVRVGKYTKIGNRVLANCYVAWNSGNGTGDLIITGLPFTSNSTSNNLSSVICYNSQVAMPANSYLQAYIGNSSSSITFTSAVVGGGADDGGTDYDAAGLLILSFQYPV